MHSRFRESPFARVQLLEMWILREIRERGGEVGFRRFMELALYHPEHGYYASERAPWGRDGDYLTAPTASGWYGATWAGLLDRLSQLERTQVADWWISPPVTVHLSPRCSRVGRRRGAVFWRSDGRGSIGGHAGARRSPARWRRRGCGDRCSRRSHADDPVVIHASELYDAMPVHRVEQTPQG